MREDMFMIYNQKEGKKRRKKETYRDQTLSLKFINDMCVPIFTVRDRLVGVGWWQVVHGSIKKFQIFSHSTNAEEEIITLSRTQLPVFTINKNVKDTLLIFVLHFSCVKNRKTS